MLRFCVVKVAYALDVPWYASLPRVETRFYIDQYGGESDVWIGKTLYRYFALSSHNNISFPTQTTPLYSKWILDSILLHILTKFIIRPKIKSNYETAHVQRFCASLYLHIILDFFFLNS